MRLKNLAQYTNLTAEAAEISFTGLANNSKLVTPGDLFIAIPGYKTDGFLYLAEAFNRGAVAAFG